MSVQSDDHHRVAADAFAEAVRRGQRPQPGSRNIFYHLSVLNELARRHPLQACKQYAASADIPWGKFGSLDALRIVALMAPSRGADQLDDFPTEAPSLDYIIFRNPQSEKIIFVFTGAHRQFGAPLRLIHHWFKRLDATIVYVFDMDWTYYLGVVRGLGSCIEETTSSLERIAEEIGAKSRYCAGNSGGGFGALLYSIRLKARRTLVFSPPTVIRESLPRIQPKAGNLNDLLFNDCIDLREIYRRSASPPPPARVYFPVGNERDRIEAENIADVENVDLQPVEFDSHNLIPMMIQRKRFLQILEWLPK